MSRRTKITVIFGATLALLLCMLLILLDQTQFIHVYGYEAQEPVNSSALLVKMRVQPLKGVRNEIPERVVGPPYSIVMVIDCPQNIQEVRLKRLIVNGCDGGSEDCRITVEGGVPQNGAVVVDAMASEGEWGEHINVIATLEMTTKNKIVEVRVEFPIKKSHKRVLKIPGI